VGGTVELASIDAKPDWRRADVTLRHAQRALPGLQAKDTTRWMGHRPALPDTVPIISASARTRGLFYATGHGHLGLTNAATTARLIGQMIRGETPDIDLAPYRIDRY
jgi:D-amino-acid dehydrogenase